MTVYRISVKNLITSIIGFIVLLVISFNFICNGFFALSSLFITIKIKSESDLPQEYIFSCKSYDKKEFVTTNYGYNSMQMIMSAESMGMLKNKYGSYKFSIKPDKIYESGISREEWVEYTISDSWFSQSFESDRTITQRYLYCLVDSTFIIVSVPFDQEMHEKQILSGYFTPFRNDLVYKLDGVFRYNKNYDIFAYQFNTSKSFIWNIATDLIIGAVFFALLVYILIKIILQFRDKKYRPIYKQLDFWNLSEDEINTLLENKTKTKGVYYLGKWKLIPRTFKAKITANIGNNRKRL